MRRKPDTGEGDGREMGGGRFLRKIEELEKGTTGQFVLWLIHKPYNDILVQIRSQEFVCVLFLFQHRNAHMHKVRSVNTCYSKNLSKP